MLVSLETDPTDYVIWRLSQTHEINKDTDPRKVAMIARIFTSMRYIIYE